MCVFIRGEVADGSKNSRTRTIYSSRRLTYAPVIIRIMSAHFSMMRRHIRFMKTLVSMLHCRKSFFKCSHCEMDM